MMEAGDYLIGRNGETYRFLEGVKKNENSPIYRVKCVLEGEENQIRFIKFAYKDGEIYGVNNLTREGGFQFYYPFIEHVYGGFEAVDSAGRTVYAVSMEYIEGVDLREYRPVQGKLLREGKLKEEEFDRTMFRQMLEFLQGMNYYLSYVPGDRYLHRDLKPSNIMIDRNGQAVIVDFDYAHIPGSVATRRIGTGWGLGMSHGYTDPRIMRGIPPDVKADIYSAGRTFFYWLNGRDYFSASEHYENAAVAYGLEQSRFNEKRYLEKRYGGLLNIIGKMCCEPKNRYGDTASVISDYMDFLLEYCRAMKFNPEDYLEQEKMPLLQEKRWNYLSHVRNVAYKICLPDGEKLSRPLYNYKMRDIKIQRRTVMTIYNLNGVIYYIPYTETLRRSRPGDDYEIRMGDCFTVGKAGGTEIRFWL